MIKPNSCNQNCEQGRKCDCAPLSPADREKLDSVWARVDDWAAAVLIVVAFFIIVEYVVAK